MTRLVYVRVPARWQVIDPVCACVVTCLEARGLVRFTDRVNVVLHELLENAVKYSAPGNDAECDLTISEKTLELVVSNHANEVRLKILEKEFTRIAAKDDSAAKAFARAVERLKESVGVARLGLIRAAVEAELSLDATGDLVRVMAVFR